MCITAVFYPRLFHAPIVERLACEVSEHVRAVLDSFLMLLSVVGVTRGRGEAVLGFCCRFESWSVRSVNVAVGGVLHPS